MNQVENTVKFIGIEEMRATLKPQRAFSIHHMQVLKLDVRSSLSHTRARACAHTHTHTHTHSPMSSHLILKLSHTKKATLRAQPIPTLAVFAMDST